jgi:hypothetical protein
MSVLRIGSGYVRFGSVVQASASSGVTSRTRAAQDPAAARAALRSVTRMQAALVELKDALRRAGATSQAAVAQGTVALSDTVTGASAATMTSTAEINTETTSFTPTSPSWNGLSTPTVTVSGTYDGANGTSNTLRFRKTTARPNTRLVVTDTSGTTIATLQWGGAESSTTAKAVGNGLSVSMSSKLAINNDYFEITVSSGDQQVDPEVAFNADPNFEVGKSVTAGSFTINGTSIAVSATDTLNTVLDRITASSAGVTAEYDATTETVLLTQKTAGSTPTITLGADSSGFLSAVKLAGATVTPGTDQVVGLTGPMQDVAQLSGVTAGSITVNGVSIAIDPTTQSIYDVLDAVELNVPAVSAALNATTGRVILSSVSAGASFTIDSGTTGFFDALGIDDGTYEGRSGVSSRSSARATEALRDVREAFTQLFDDAALTLDGTTRLPSEVPSLRSALATLVKQRFGSDTSLDTGFGLSFAFEASEGGSVSGSMEFGRSDEPAFARAFRQRSRAVLAFFLQPMSSSGDGLIDRMLDTLADSRTSLKARADG